MTSIIKLQSRWLIVFSIIFISNGSVIAQTERTNQSNYMVLFDVAQSKITKHEQSRAKAFYDKELKNAPEIRLNGHTDSDGGDNYNQNLSKSRVETVKAFLIDMGYPVNQIVIDYSGEKKPLNENRSDEQKRVNRRVSIDWDIPVEEKLGDIRDLYKLLKDENQTHCIDPTRDTILRLEQGTIIGIPAYAFNTSSKECVTFKAKEVYKFSDMILENLTTTSDGRLLETGGMVYTEANDATGKELKLNLGKELTIMLPTDTIRDDMKLFYGDRDPHGMNWDLAPEVAFQGYNYSYCYPLIDNDVCAKCPILTCRLFGHMDDAFKGMFDKNVKQDNKEFRKCQRNLRKSKLTRVTYNWTNETYCNNWYSSFGGGDWRQIQDSLRVLQEQTWEEKFEKWGVSNMEQFRDTVQKYKIAQREAQMQAEFEKFGVSNMEEYYDTIRKINEQKEKEYMEGVGNDLESGKGDIDGLKYYVAKTTKMGWINCDAFSSSKKPRITMVIADSKQNSETDCNLIFTDRKSVMRAGSGKDKKFRFSQIISGLAVWVLTIKYTNNKIFLSLENRKTTNSTAATNFKEVTIDELKEELRKLDV